MKTLLFFGALALSLPAVSGEKNYQYKDLTLDQANPVKSDQKREPGAVKKEYKRPAKTIEEKIEDAKKAR